MLALLTYPGCRAAAWFAGTASGLVGWVRTIRAAMWLARITLPYRSRHVTRRDQAVAPRVVPGGRCTPNGPRLPPAPPCSDGGDEPPLTGTWRRSRAVVLPRIRYLAQLHHLLAGPGWRWSVPYLPLPAMALTAMAYALSPHLPGTRGQDRSSLLAGGCLCCLICHGELAPSSPRRAPHLVLPHPLARRGLGRLVRGGARAVSFVGFYELPLGLAACALLAASYLSRAGTAMAPGVPHPGAARPSRCWVTMRRTSTPAGQGEG
jgi:hypothetical protein